MTTAFVRLLRVQGTLRRRLESRLLAEHGLTLTDYEALALLVAADEGAMRRVDLAAELGVSPSGVTRLLDGLEAAGYVAKGQCASDARVTYAVVTPAGRECFAAARELYRDALAESMAARLAPEELAQLGDLLGRLPGADDADACPLDEAGAAAKPAARQG